MPITAYLLAVTDAGVDYKVANHVVNILAYADDLVLIAPSWRTLQTLISVLYAHALEINMTLNTQTTVSMVFSPKPPQFIVMKISEWIHDVGR